MKAIEIDRMTTVYRRMLSRRRAQKTVILSTGIWVPTYGVGTDAGPEPTGYRMLPAGAVPAGREGGWLCLTVEDWTDAGQALADEQILSLAEPAFAAIEAGSLPDLPSGLRIGLISAREISEPWAKWEASREQSRAARAAAAARVAEQQAADEAARQRILATIGLGDLLPISRLINMQTTGAWTALEGLLTTYADARSKSAALGG